MQRVFCVNSNIARFFEISSGGCAGELSGMSNEKSAEKTKKLPSVLMWFACSVALRLIYFTFFKKSHKKTVYKCGKYYYNVTEICIVEYAI